MVITRPNVLVDVYRGTVVDDDGDTVDDTSAGAKIHTGMPVSIIEASSKTGRFDEQKPRVVRRYVGRVGYGADIRRGDRLVSTHGAYLVDSTTQPEKLAHHAPDLRLELRAQANNP